jgi:hypothetical protein
MGERFVFTLTRSCRTTAMSRAVAILAKNERPQSMARLDASLLGLAVAAGTT